MISHFTVRWVRDLHVLIDWTAEQKPSSEYFGDMFVACSLTGISFKAKSNVLAESRALWWLGDPLIDYVSCMWCELLAEGKGKDYA